MAYSKILQRIRSEKTNYRKRKIMLMGKRDFITVNVTNENTQVQIVKPEIKGDKVLASAHSRFLIKRWMERFSKKYSCIIFDRLHGWKKSIIKWRN